MSQRLRLDQALVQRKLVQTRSEAENWIKLGKVTVNGVVALRSGVFVGADCKIALTTKERYVSRAGLKLSSVAKILQLDFTNKTVLDVGSSTGGFTDYALQHSAKKVYAVDVGTGQLHLSLQNNKQIELHEKTDIRDFRPTEKPNIVVMDVSFISLRVILPHIAEICDKDSQVVAMLKPQFEAGKNQVNKGVIKNDAIRRQILKDFEVWVREYFIITNKADSRVAGAKGNRERFYLLQPIV